jgi:hypothetical protein
MYVALERERERQRERERRKEKNERKKLELLYVRHPWIDSFKNICFCFCPHTYYQYITLVTNVRMYVLTSEHHIT